MVSPITLAADARAVQFDHIRLRLSRFWCVLAIAVSTLNAALNAAGLLPHVSIEAQVGILAIAVAVFGVPHGALDHWVARDLLRPRLGGVWVYIFLAAYLGVAGLVMVGFWLAPPVMLILFLFVSVIHFGLGDAGNDSDSGNDHNRDHNPDKKPVKPAKLIWFCDVFLTGLISIVVPWLVFPDEVSLLFGWLAQTPAAVWYRLPTCLASILPYQLIVATLVLAIVALWWRRRTTGTIGATGAAGFANRVVELIATVSLFVFLPPLLAFTVYFCGLHAPRHLVFLAQHLSPVKSLNPPRASGWVLMQSLPLTLATIAGAALVYFWLRGHDEQTALARVIFWGLAALTFPHMLLTALWESKLSALSRSANWVRAVKNRNQTQGDRQ